MILRMAPLAHFGWLCEQLGHPVASDMKALEALDSSGGIAAMAGYFNWRPNSVMMLFASARPLVWRALLPHAFLFPFQTRDILRAEIPSHSGPMLAVARRFGFRERYRIVDGFTTGDDVIGFEMHKNECRYQARA